MKKRKQALAAYRARVAQRAKDKEQRKIATLQNLRKKIKSAEIGKFVKWPAARPGALIIYRRNGQLYSRDSETRETTDYTPEQVRKLLSHGKAIIIPVETPF